MKTQRYGLVCGTHDYKWLLSEVLSSLLCIVQKNHLRELQELKGVRWVWDHQTGLQTTFFLKKKKKKATKIT